MAVALVAAGCASRPKPHWAASPRNVVEVKSPAPPRTNSVAEPGAEALAHFAAGVSYEANTNHVLALSHFEQAAQADPGNEPLVIELSRQYLARKETQKALDLLKKAAKHPNATAGGFRLAGRGVSKVRQDKSGYRSWSPLDGDVADGFGGLSQSGGDLFANW